MKYYLGLDAGGTNLAAGIVDEQFHIVSHASIPSGAGRGIEKITEDMIRVCDIASRKAGLQLENFEEIGIGMPSYVNPSTQLLVHANCFGWKNVPIFNYLEQHYAGKIFIENDANCAVLGETLAGNGKGFKNIVMLTLGTGVGGGILLNGKIFAGADLMGAELGHTKLIYGGRRCTCGQYGCVDTYCSAGGLIHLAKEAKKKYPDSILYRNQGKNSEQLNTKIIFQAADQNDSAAQEAIEQYLEYLACAISNFVAVFRPEIILLGGGVANAGERLRKPLQEKLNQVTFAGGEIGVPKIKMAACGNDAGIIGAAFLSKYGMDRKRSV